MKLKIILATVAMLALQSGCSRSDSSSSGGQAHANKHAPAPKQEDESKADWQLLDDSMFIATIDPWPPKEGTVTLKAEATMDDGDQKFTGTVAYRLATAEESSGDWKPMPRVGEDKDGSIHFAAPITLTNGTVYIHFHVRDGGDKDFTDLTDWKITVK